MRGQARAFCTMASPPGFRGVCTFLTAAALWGCSSSVRQPLIVEFAPHEADLVGETFAAGESILSGFDAPAEDQQWQIGDQVLCGILLEQDGARTVRYARLTLRTGVLAPRTRIELIAPGSPSARDADDAIYLLRDAPESSVDSTTTFVAQKWSLKLALRHPRAGAQNVAIESNPVFVLVEIFDESAHRISSSHAFAPERALRSGLYDLTRSLLLLRQRLGTDIAQILEAHPEEFDVPSSQVVDLFGSLFALRDAVWTCPSLIPILNATIQRPSLLSIILNAGIRFGVKPDYAGVSRETRSLPALTAGRDALRLPVTVYLNREPSMNCTLIVARSRPPLMPIAGLVGLDLTHPTDDGRRLILRVLAARRGRTP